MRKFLLLHELGRGLQPIGGQLLLRPVLPVLIFLQPLVLARIPRRLPDSGFLRRLLPALRALKLQLHLLVAWIFGHALRELCDRQREVFRFHRRITGRAMLVRLSLDIGFGLYPGGLCVTGFQFEHPRAQFSRRGKVSCFQSFGAVCELGADLGLLCGFHIVHFFLRRQLSLRVTQRRCVCGVVLVEL